MQPEDDEETLGWGFRNYTDGIGNALKYACGGDGAATLGRWFAESIASIWDILIRFTQGVFEAFRLDWVFGNYSVGVGKLWKFACDVMGNARRGAGS